MSRCLLLSDLHGDRDKYRRLFRVIAAEKPNLVFLAGDLLPSGGGWTSDPELFLHRVLLPNLYRLKKLMRLSYPKIMVIMGNDDPRYLEPVFERYTRKGFWQYLHGHTTTYNRIPITGCSFIPPSPFINKDWERYDVSRFVDVGSTPPEEGRFTVPINMWEIRYNTIMAELDKLAVDQKPGVWLLHAPPYDTGLDRADLDGRMVDAAPMDVHVGSIAVQRFIQKYKPRLTLHGHVHEAYRLTGVWKQKIDDTWCLSAAGESFTVVRFNFWHPEEATREEQQHV